MRVVEACSQKFFIVCKQFYSFTGSNITGKTFEFVAEYPKMTFLDPVVFFWLEVEGLHGLKNVSCFKISLFYLDITFVDTMQLFILVPSGIFSGEVSNVVPNVSVAMCSKSNESQRK